MIAQGILVIGLYSGGNLLLVTWALVYYLLDIL